jgi:ABC-2 type transport system ATP-binding protein
MNMITGYTSITSGKIMVSGIDVEKSPKAAKRKIGYLPEFPPLYGDMKTREYLRFVCELKGIKYKKYADQIDEIADLAKIDDVMNKLIKSLSKGYKQRVGIAAALVGDPELLILDEPTVGLDPKQIIETRNLIKSLGEKHTVLLSSHILSEVAAISDNIIIINHGKIIAEDKPENLYKKINDQNKILATIKGFKNDILNVLWEIPGVVRVKIKNKLEDNAFEIIIESRFDAEIKKPLQRALVENDMELLSLKDEDASLEEIFLKFIQKDDHQLPSRELWDVDMGHGEPTPRAEKLAEEEKADDENGGEGGGEKTDEDAKKSEGAKKPLEMPEFWKVKLKDLKINPADMAMVKDDLKNLNEFDSVGLEEFFEQIDDDDFDPERDKDDIGYEEDDDDDDENDDDYDDYEDDEEGDN